MWRQGPFNSPPPHPVDSIQCRVTVGRGRGALRALGSIMCYQGLPHLRHGALTISAHWYSLQATWTAPHSVQVPRA